MTQRLTYVEIDIDRCSLTYGTSPCTASIPTTGARKCYNSLGTCQDSEHFDDEGVTIRFAIDTAFLPNAIECIPCVQSISFSPAILNPGVDIGKRASVAVVLQDHPDSDTGPHGDPYLVDRNFDAFNQGTFFGKFRARHPYLRGRALRIIRGEVGDDLADMEIRHFVIDSFDGPLPDGTFTITAKDPIKLADSERSQAPLPSKGYASLAVADSDTSVTLLPTGVGVDYPVSGYAGLGGKEIVYFEHDPYPGLTAATKLLLHFNGSDASTTITDSSGNGRNGSCNGNAQLDTALYKFGTASLLLDGTGDYVSVADNNDWDPSGDCTIDCWIRPTDFAGHMNICGRWSGSTANYWRLRIPTDASILFEIVASSSQVVLLQSAAAAITAGVWQHVAMTRSGDNWKIFINGVIVASVTDSSGFANLTGTLNIGINVDGTTEAFKGSIDEFRFHHTAFWTADFSDRLPGPYASSTDTFTITRAQYNTTAVSHSAEARFQLCLNYASFDPADIIYDLLVNYAGIDSSLIELTDWRIETNAHFGALFTALIAEPTSVITLLNELIEQACLALWWDDLGQKLRLKVLQPVSASATIWDETLQMRGSLSVKDQPDKRVSQVWTYFAQINPLRKLDETDNFRSIAVEADIESETNYGSAAIKKVFSRWIATGGRATASRLNQILIARYKNPPRRATLNLFRDGVQQPALGSYAQLQAWFIQDDTGASDNVPIQITRIGPEDHCFKIEAEEFNFDSSVIDETSGINTVSIDSDINSINFRTIFDALYPTPTSGDTVQCVISSGVVVGSSDASVAAFEIGTWPAGVTVNVVVNGTILGAGGEGGSGSDDTTPGSDGEKGGTALKTATPINLSGTGKIWAGGGGGGGGGGLLGNPSRGSGGGGGQGKVGGPGGSGARAGSSGTPDSNGAGGAPLGWGLAGGSGGEIGEAGNDGVSDSFGYTTLAVGGKGGDAGNAIDGDSYITETGSLTVTGSRVN